MKNIQVHYIGRSKDGKQIVVGFKWTRGLGKEQLQSVCFLPKAYLAWRKLIN